MLLDQILRVRRFLEALVLLPRRIFLRITRSSICSLRFLPTLNAILLSKLPELFLCKYYRYRSRYQTVVDNPCNGPCVFDRDDDAPASNLHSRLSNQQVHLLLACPNTQLPPNAIAHPFFPLPSHTTLRNGQSPNPSCLRTFARMRPRS